MKRRASQELNSSDSSSVAGPDIVLFNAGNTHLSTSLQTLRRSAQHFPDSLFAVLFAGDEWRSQCDEQGAYFVDRDAALFGQVLQVLRYPPQFRDALAPPQLSAELWQYELGFWGLLDPVTSAKRATTAAPLDTADTALLQLGRSVRQRMRSVELEVVQLLLRATGYAEAETGVGRFARLYCPVDQHRLTCGQDLGRYLQQQQNRHAVLRRLQQVLAPCYVELKELPRGAEPVSYQFNGERYNSEAHATLELTIDCEYDEDEEPQ